MSAPVSRNAGRGMRIEEWAYVRSGIHVAKPSVFVSYRQRGRVPGVLFLAYIGDLVAANAVCPELDEAVNRSPLGAVLIWVPFALCAAASLVMAFRYVIRIGSAERLLDAPCDPTALAARGDELGLGIRMPRCGYTRVEAVLMQRWAVALVEVGRLADAAVARRRLGESLAGRRRPGRSPYGASLCMLLADVSARLDAGGGRVAAGPRVGRGGGGGIGCHHAHLPRSNFSDPRFVGVGSSRAIAASACAAGSSTGWTPAHWWVTPDSRRRRRSRLLTWSSAWLTAQPAPVTPRQREPSAHLASPG